MSAGVAHASWLASVVAEQDPWSVEELHRLKGAPRQICTELCRVPEVQQARRQGQAAVQVPLLCLASETPLTCSKGLLHMH